MKKLCLLLALLFSSTLFAGQPVFLYGHCYYSFGNAQCEVINNTNQRVFCSLQAQGWTTSHAYAQGFSQAWLAPYQFGRIELRANDPRVDPIVSAQVSANCTTL